MSWLLMTAGAAVYLGYRLLGKEHRLAFRGIVLPALIFGAVALFLEFLLNIILSTISRPDAGSRFLLDIVITGPSGFLVGLLYGIGLEMLRRKRRARG